MDVKSQAYNTLHKWVRNNMGRAEGCTNCQNKSDKRYHWANISHEYKRDSTDWRQLCAYCHKRYDLTGNLPVWE